MAAYGALVSVMHIMDQIHRHPLPPISIHREHAESLTANVTFLQEFLEGYNPHVSYTAEADPLESRIAEAAYIAEDVIESYIVDHILARSINHVEEISSAQFYEGLQYVKEEMDLIKIDVTKKMKEKKMGVQIIKKSMTNGGASRSSSTVQKVTTMIGFDDVLNQMLDKITGGGVDRQILPIIGMGGLGKTTLARNIYAHPLINEHFDVCAWSTISQVHNARKILSEILGQVDRYDMGDMSEYELGEKLYKYLIGRRYLIVMDDMWSIEAWEVVRKFFPDNGNGSRVVVTTRLSNLASMFDYSNGLDMKFLDEASSWDLFSKTVFGETNCPLELEEIGKKIVEGCRGLPLSIVVAGGLLSKSKPTQENWELIQENLSSAVNSEGDGSCLQILYVSYNNLPVYMKPCFLYMGVFREDEEITVFLLILLWVAEGFIKSFDGKSLEEVGEEYLEELIDRNLVVVEERDDCGKVKSFKMHDLLRDLTLKEAKKDNFVCALMQSSDLRGISRDSISTQRRIAFSLEEEYPPNPLLECVEPALALVRSLLGDFPETFYISNFRLLRVCLVNLRSVGENLFRLVNLRIIMVDVDELLLLEIPFLWNLQTLFLSNEAEGEDYVLDIWKMPLLRHVFTDDNGKLSLPDPPLSGDDGDEVVLQNLHTLREVTNLILSENVLKRIPNINTLALDYDKTSRRVEELADDFCLNNLRSLHKLQVLKITTSSLNVHQHTLAFPYSLKELMLKGTMLHWEEMETKIGCLPLLQVLKLEENSFTGSEWETVEGQFSSLKFLAIEDCPDLEYWNTDNTHFPRLEHLIVRHLTELREIPLCIGDITTLRSIELEDCSDSSEESAQRILEEQEEYGNELLQIRVIKD